MAERLKKVWVSETEAEDRISRIPDVLLTYILSFVTTKEAVRTSVLSKRWKSLWAQVPVLDMRNWEFPPMGGDLILQDRQKADYLTFVNQFIRQSKPSSIKLLVGISGHDLSVLDSWISVAKKQKIEELLLDINYYHVFPSEISRISHFISFNHSDTRLENENSLPHIGKLHISAYQCIDQSLVNLWVAVTKRCDLFELQLDVTDQKVNQRFLQNLFSCQMLVILKLQGFVGLKFSTASFPKLKVLHLTKIVYKDNDSLCNLINSSCPLLEELNIERKCRDNVQHLIVTSRTLRHLRIYFRPCRFSRCQKTLIDAPALQYLDLEDEVSEKYYVGDFGELIEAKFDVYLMHYSAFELIRSSSSVKRLVLSDHTMKALHITNSGYDLWTFHRLTCLEIRVYGDLCGAFVSWNLVLESLRRCPKLKHLTFQGILFRLDDELDDVPNCLLSQLETIKFHCLRIEEDELRVVRYLLKNSKVLKKMKMYYCPKVIEKRVLAIPRTSTACQIEFGCRNS